MDSVSGPRKGRVRVYRMSEASAGYELLSRLSAPKGCPVVANK